MLDYATHHTRAISGLRLIGTATGKASVLSVVLDGSTNDEARVAEPRPGMTNFTPFTALAGGLLIGLAAILLLWLSGRIAGVSSIAGGLWFSARGERAWRLLFIGGLILGAGGWVWLAPAAPLPRTNFPVGLLVLAGLLVGYGTALGGGCTSGHGVCGLARLSLRSLVATGTFLGVAIVTTFVVRHLLHLA